MDLLVRERRGRRLPAQLTASPTSTSSPPRCAGSPTVARRSIRPSSASSSAGTASDDPLGHLTPREREVLEYMAEGRSNQAIAERLFVTLRAVEKHVTSIFVKLRPAGHGGRSPPRSRGARSPCAASQLPMGKVQGQPQGDAGYRLGTEDLMLQAPWQARKTSSPWASRRLPSRAGTAFRTPRHWPAAWFWPFATCESADMSFAPYPHARRPVSYPGRIEIAALAALYGALRARPRLRQRGLAAARAAYLRHRRARAPPPPLRRARRRAVLLASRRGLAARPHSTSSCISAGTAAALTCAPPPPARVSVPPHDTDRQHRAGADRYVLYPAAPPRLAGLGFADTVTTHTGLNLSSDLLGSLLQPDRGRPEPALRLLADRRRRDRAARLVPLAAHRRCRSTPPRCS